MPSVHHLRTSPDDCLVGDLIAAADVPEWSTEASTQAYQPIGGSLTAAALNAVVENPGDEISRGDGLWIFEIEPMETRPNAPTPVWRRVS